MQWSQTELAWAAGLFDGEGHIANLMLAGNRSRGYSKKYRKIQMTINQNDREVLDRFQAAVGDVGQVRGPYSTKTRPNENPIWRWSTQKIEDVKEVVWLIYPYLSGIKRQQSWDALKGYRLSASALPLAS